jgi:transmembrane sensor
MDARPEKPNVNHQIQQEAAQWLVEFNADEPDSTARAQFDRWLRASPEHIRAYMELLPLWSDSASLGDVENMSREELIALATAGGGNVATLSQGAEGHQRSHGARDARAKHRKSGLWANRRYFRPLAAAAAMLVAVAAAFVWQATSGSHTYRTGIAEIRTLTLEDGTRLSIGARSSVTVAYSQSARAFKLEAGDIYVDVAKDALGR